MYCQRVVDGAHYRMTYHARQTVYNYFRHWQRLGVWQQIHTQIRHRVRKSVDQTELASAGMIDSQSVKTTEKKGRSTALMAAS
jgi:transposase